MRHILEFNTEAVSLGSDDLVTELYSGLEYKIMACMEVDTPSSCCAAFRAREGERSSLFFVVVVMLIVHFQFVLEAVKFCKT